MDRRVQVLDRGTPGTAAREATGSPGYTISSVPTSVHVCSQHVV